MMSACEPVFKLFANCVPVRGARRSIVCDLQRHRYDFIPEGLYRILTEMKGLCNDEIKASFDLAQHEIIDDYFTFLEKKDYGFYCTEPDLFPELDLTWMAPEHITNAIIDVDADSDHPFESIFAQLDSLLCKALQLRFFSATGPQEIGRILNLSARGGLSHIDMLFPYSDEFTDDLLQGLCLDHPRVSRIVVYGAPSCREIKLPSSGVPISFITARCDSPTCCGQVAPKYFAINVEHFTEAQMWNTCLNRKISISANGDIRNCPSLPDSFGHISTTSLSMALAAPHYKELWGIAKNQIKICRDCEFRYICTDCRAYREDQSDIYSKPLKCGYDPYSAEWVTPSNAILSNVDIQIDAV